MELPKGAFLKEISATYNEHTIPRVLLVPQVAPPDLWCQVIVVEGRIQVALAGSAQPFEATPDAPALIPPGTAFRVLPAQDPVRFCLHYFHVPLVEDLGAQAMLSRTAA